MKFFSCWQLLYFSKICWTKHVQYTDALKDQICNAHHLMLKTSMCVRTRAKKFHSIAITSPWNYNVLTQRLDTVLKFITGINTCDHRIRLWTMVYPYTNRRARAMSNHLVADSSAILRFRKSPRRKYFATRGPWTVVVVVKYNIVIDNCRRRRAGTFFIFYRQKPRGDINEVGRRAGRGHGVGTEREKKKKKRLLIITKSAWSAAISAVSVSSAVGKINI